MTLESAPFVPAWWVPGAHLQTVWGRMTRPRQLVRMRREPIEMPDGDVLVLDHVDIPDGSGNLRAVLLHGLEGSSYSVYIQGVLSLLSARGIPATVINFRSCARDPLRTKIHLPNRRPRFYHSGETTDLDHVIRLLSARHPQSRFVAFGASLGGNVLLKWLGENRGQKLVERAVAVSVPYDLAAGARYLETPMGRFYCEVFFRSLRPKVERLVREFPDVGARVDLERIRRAKSFFDFDQWATAPIHGFAGAEDYWERSSSIRVLSQIDVPVLCISSADDPFLPPRVIDEVEAVASSTITLIRTRGGGHVGFVGGRRPWEPAYWAERKAAEYLT
ncbi:MAG: alpha/beta fold hydrolase [Thermoanaerobaculia bacterium]